MDSPARREREGEGFIFRAMMKFFRLLQARYHTVFVLHEYLCTFSCSLLFFLSLFFVLVLFSCCFLLVVFVKRFYYIRKILFSSVVLAALHFLPLPVVFVAATAV